MVTKIGQARERGSAVTTPFIEVVIFHSTKIAGFITGYQFQYKQSILTTSLPIMSKLTVLSNVMLLSC